VAATDDTVQGFDFWKYVKSFFGGEAYPDPATVEAETVLDESQKPDTSKLQIELIPSDLARALHAHDPDRYPAVAEKADEARITIPIYAPEFKEFRQTAVDLHRPVTLNVQEAFMMYMKVAMIGGLIIASPWVFFQLWLFVAAGLYPHERRYIYIYLPVSIGLFLGGCVLLLRRLRSCSTFSGFNRMLGLTPQIRISDGQFQSPPLMLGSTTTYSDVVLGISILSVESSSDESAVGDSGDIDCRHGADSHRGSRQYDAHVRPARAPVRAGDSHVQLACTPAARIASCLARTLSNSRQGMNIPEGMGSLMRCKSARKGAIAI
jgi:hypothetical protein